MEIVDRGPHVKGRDIDLSKAAAKQLGILEEIRKGGEAKVRIEVTKEQLEEAIETPKEEKKVEQQLKEARREAAKKGTPQPQIVIDLKTPQEQVAAK